MAGGVIGFLGNLIAPWVALVAAWVLYGVLGKGVLGADDDPQEKELVRERGHAEGGPHLDGGPHADHRQRRGLATVVVVGMRAK